MVEVQCRHLIPAQYARVDRTTTKRPIGASKSDPKLIKVSAERNFDTCLRGSFMCLDYSYDVLSMFVQPVADRRPVDWCWK